MSREWEGKKNILYNLNKVLKLIGSHELIFQILRLTNFKQCTII